MRGKRTGRRQRLGGCANSAYQPRVSHTPTLADSSTEAPATYGTTQYALQAVACSGGNIKS
jgi:hypothetical protein